MHDTCVIQTFTTTADSMGEEIRGAAVESAPVACGFKFAVKKGENEGADYAVLETDAILRISHTDGVDITTKDRIKITHRHGEALATPDLFEVVSVPYRGPSGVQLELRRVEV